MKRRLHSGPLTYSPYIRSLLIGLVVGYTLLVAAGWLLLRGWRQRLQAEAN